MNIRRAALVALLAFCSSAAVAADHPQVFATVTFTEPSGHVVGQSFVVSGTRTFWSVGQNNGYPAVICTATSRELKAVTLFSGYLVQEKLDGNSVTITVKKYTVSVPPKSAYEPSGSCNTVLPRQRVLINKTYHLNTGVSGQTIQLPDGTVMKYSITRAAS